MFALAMADNDGNSMGLTRGDAAPAAACRNAEAGVGEGTGTGDDVGVTTEGTFVAGPLEAATFPAAVRDGNSGLRNIDSRLAMNKLLTKSLSSSTIKGHPGKPRHARYLVLHHSTHKNGSICELILLDLL